MEYIKILSYIFNIFDNNIIICLSGSYHFVMKYSAVLIAK